MSKATKIVLSVISIFLFLCLYETLFDPLAPYTNRKKLDGLQVELNTAKAKWDSQNIKNYSIEVQYFIPMIEGYYGSPNINSGLLRVYITESEFRVTAGNFQRLDNTMP